MVRFRQISCGTITVRGAFDAGRVSLTSCSIGQRDVQRGGGGSITGTHTWENTNSQGAIVTVSMSVGGQSVPVSYTETVPAGGSVTVEWSVAVAELPVGSGLDVTVDHSAEAA